MAGPVYLQGDNKHNFDVIQKHLDTLKEVHGPVYITENAKHSFSEVQKAAEQIKNLNHPVLNTGEAKNHFNQMISSAETLKNMNGRWINGSQETMVKFAILILQILNENDNLYHGWLFCFKGREEGFILELVQIL